MGMILGNEEEDELKTIGMYPEISLCIYVYNISYNYTWMSGVWAKTLQSTSYTTPHCYRSVLSNAKIMMKSKFIYFGEIQLIFKECNIFLMIFICLESMTEIVGGPDIYVDRLSTLQLTCR